MRKIHRQNLTIVWIGVIALIGLSFMSFGLSFAGIGGSIVLLLAGLTASSGYFFVKNDLATALMITLSPTLATFIYSFIQGGNAVTFLANFVTVAMVARYFNYVYLRCYLWTVGPLSLICVAFFPQIIDGGDYSYAGVLSKELFFIVVGVILLQTVQRGQAAVKEAEDTLQIVRERGEESNLIAGNLNNAIDDASIGIQDLVTQAETVAQAADQISTTIESTTNSTIAVNERVTEAGEQIDRNVEMAQKVEESFRVVTESVDHGNEEAKNVQQSLRDMSVTVSSAKESTDALVGEMDKISGILGEINSIASQTNLLSLNASIEAARAGEAGKGFAVVADQIRLLSEQSSNASNNIRDIIEQLVEATSVASQKIDAGAAAAEEGVSQMNVLLDVFAGIRESSEAAGNVVQEEYEVMENIKSDFVQIHNEVENLVAITEENSAMIQNIAESVAHQHESVSGVEEEIRGIAGLSDDLRKMQNEGEAEA